MSLELSFILFAGGLLCVFYIVLGIIAVKELFPNKPKKQYLRILLNALTLLVWPAAVFIAVLIGAYKTIVD